jgi:hypothetical protein
VAYSRFYSGIYVKGLRKITGNLSQDRQCPVLNSNLAPFERELTALPLCICFSPEAHKPYINSNNSLGTSTCNPAVDRALWNYSSLAETFTNTHPELTKLTNSMKLC